jgi:hypothetical protein
MQMRTKKSGWRARNVVAVRQFAAPRRAQPRNPLIAALVARNASSACGRHGKSAGAIRRMQSEQLRKEIRWATLRDPSNGGE